MIETWIQLRGDNKPCVTSSTSHPNHAHDPNESSDDEEDDDAEEEQDDNLNDTLRKSHLTYRPTAHSALPRTAPVKIFS